jgi:hypothetical protein
MTRPMFSWTSRISVITEPAWWESIFPQRWFTWLVVAAVFGLSAILGLYSGNQLKLLISVLLAGVAGIIFLLRWPEMGILAIIAGTFLLRRGVGFGGNELYISLILLPGLIFLWLLDLFVGKKQLWFVNSRPLLSLVAFCSASLLSFGMGQLPWFLSAESAPITSQITALSLFLLSAGAVILVAHQIKDIKWLKRMTWIFLAFGAFNIAGGINRDIGNQFYSIFPLATGSIVWVWVVALSLSQALFNTRMRMGWRIILLALAVSVFIVAFTVWRVWNSGWVPSSIVIAAILALRFPKLIPIFLVAGMIVLAIMLPGVIEEDQYSYDTRLEAWRIVLGNIVPVNPLFGVGPANYRFFTPLFPIMGWAVQFNSHNNYVDIIAQIGFVGLACFAWFFIEIGRLGWKLRKQVPQHGFAHAYTIGALAGIAGTLVSGMLGDWVIPFVYNVGLNGFRSSLMGWLFLGGVIVIGQIYSGSNLETSAKDLQNKHSEI